MEATAGADSLPTAVVRPCNGDNNVSVTVGERGTIAPLATDYSSAPYSFTAQDSRGDQPLASTFGSLLFCDGGLLKAPQGRFRILVLSSASSVQAPPPKTPANKSTTTTKPPYPPRNGISRAAVRLPRQVLIEKIVDEKRPILIIQSPPATGKTSLLDLTQEALGYSPDRQVVRFSISGYDNDGLLGRLADKLGVGSLPDGFEQLSKQETWILIDDAQLAFQTECFWKVLIKDVETSQRHIHVVVAATFDLMSQGLTPLHFAEYHHVQDLRLSAQEAEYLFDGYIKLLPWASNWEAFKDTLLRFSNGHVGVLTGGIGLLHQEYSNNQKSLTQDDALDALQGDQFRVLLQRCFPCQALMSGTQRETIANTICKGPLTTKIDATRSEDPCAQLVRAGILSTNGTFSCLVAQRQYCNYFYHRPTEAPATIEELIRLSMKSISPLRLRQSSLGREFPKEAAFQQLFNEALTLQLPPDVAVCPELNTFAKNSEGKVETGELDFFVSGELKWAIELLVDGDKINEHVARFDPTNGTYRKVGHTAHLVVDCRKGRTRAVQPMARRCTLYFAPDYCTVQCQIGFEPVETISLKD